MLRAALILALAPSATPVAAAPAPHGPGCALTTAQCVQVAQELAIEAELDAEDARTFGIGLSPFDKAMALLDRRYARIRARLPRLPVVIGNEVGRVMMCQSADERARSDGRPNTHAECR